MLPVMDVSVISLDEDPSLFGGGGARDASSERERRVRVKDGLKKVPEFNSKCTLHKLPPTYSTFTHVSSKDGMWLLLPYFSTCTGIA